MSSQLRKRAEEAMAQKTLTSALGSFSEAYVVSRAKAYEGLDFEELRNSIADIKGKASQHLDALAEQFKKNAEARGAKVFRTSSPEEVKKYILNLAREKGVYRIVKSKSMASEEIHLNYDLEAAGISVKETDLGEWIIQLAGQRPSHMVLPAIHMTREQVADLFSKEISERLTTDIPKLVKVARRELRKYFFEADMGISGANIAIAESGTIVLVTNEGNARLVTTLPKIHVVLVGLEKLIPGVQDAVPILKALPRSATGQLLTSYVSMISAPTPNTDGTQKELHIILMDNQRTAMAADPQFRNALQCIRCAACLNVCPVYRLVGGHVFGHVYTGGIGTILTSWFNLMQNAEDIQGLCITCGRCKTVCPGKVNIPELILEIRRRIVQKKGMPFIQKAAFAVIRNRKLFHSLLRAGYLAQKPLAKDGFIRHLPMFFSGLAEFRSLPTVAETPFRERIKKIKQPQGGEKVAFFAGCAIDFVYPHIGEAVVKVLNKAGLEVIFPEEQSCCGTPFRGSGDYDLAAEAAIENIKALLKDGVPYVVTACASCASALKLEFVHVLETEGKTEWIAQAKELAARTYDFSTFVKKLVDEKRLTLKEAKHLERITYHDSCHAKRFLNVYEEPRTLMRKAGYDIVESFESDMCCGMGGSYTVKQPEISSRILQRKLQNIEDTHADMVCMECPGCIMQIKGGLDKTGSKIRVKHTAEILADNLR
ncbi:MAG: Lactate utilization protein B [Smithella sp. PtaU1.Bin162]|nr:MAG: Lactate utilization protein B [Smithella sp. PtaU1.Bin162]